MYTYCVDLGGIGECSKSKNLDYHSQLLKSVDMEGHVQWLIR